MEDAAEQAELSAALDEIAGMMAAQAAMLTIHPLGGEPPRSLCTTGEGMSSSQRGAALITAAALVDHAGQDGPIWPAPIAPLDGAVMLLPVDQVAGHGRLIISLFFDDPSDEKRHAAERLYLDRKPLAIGYFRFWQLSRLYRRRSETLEAALNLTDIGILLIDRTKRITFANDAGEKILAIGDGLRRLDRRISAVNLQESLCLQVALNHLAAAQVADPMERIETAMILAVQRKAGAPLVVALLAPDTVPLDTGDVAAILFVVDPELDRVRMIEPVCRLYLLSPVETRLASHLAQGRTLASASALMGIKEQTARGYMKQIFLKTSTNRQSELIVLILSSIVRLRKGMMQQPLSHTEISGLRHKAAR